MSSNSVGGLNVLGESVLFQSNTEKKEEGGNQIFCLPCSYQSKTYCQRLKYFQQLFVHRKQHIINWKSDFAEMLHPQGGLYFMWNRRYTLNHLIFHFWTFPPYSLPFAYNSALGNFFLNEKSFSISANRIRSLVCLYIFSTKCCSVFGWIQNEICRRKALN